MDVNNAEFKVSKNLSLQMCYEEGNTFSALGLTQFTQCILVSNTK